MVIELTNVLTIQRWVARSRPKRLRRGMTLIELMAAVVITTLVASVLGTLAYTIQMTSIYSDGQNAALQHSRVTLSRIQRIVNEAHASEQFPAAAVFSELVAGVRFPDTLVVWSPAGTAANPTGLPLFSELVVFCPKPSAPEQLLEIRAPSDNRQVPALSNTASWTSELTSLKTGASSRQTLLTELVRVGTIGGSNRGAVRFEVERRPTATEWASYRAGTTTWDNVSWVQGVHGPRTGLAQTWVRTELQLMPTRPGTTTLHPAIAFFGSGAAYYELHK